jgi:hypothetical protein
MEQDMKVNLNLVKWMAMELNSLQKVIGSLEDLKMINMMVQAFGTTAKNKQRDKENGLMEKEWDG